MSTYDEARWLADQELEAKAIPYLVGISGPPRSGKDSVGYVLARLLKDRHRITVAVRSLSMPMRQTVYMMLGLPYSLEHYENNKDVPLDDLGGKTIRQAMIALSEDHVKPSYGHGFWAKSLIHSVPAEAHVVIVTDMGFDVEVEVLREHYGAERCVWPQVTRPGTSFENDSRSYVGDPDYRTTVINEGDNLDQIEVCAGRIYGRLLNQFAWKLPTR